MVAYPLHNAATNSSFCLLFVIFLATNTFSSLPLLSGQVNDAHAVVKLHRRRSVSQIACLLIEPVTMACEDYEAEFTSPLSHGAALHDECSSNAMRT